MKLIQLLLVPMLTLSLCCNLTGMEFNEGYSKNLVDHCIDNKLDLNYIKLLLNHKSNPNSKYRFTTPLDAVCSNTQSSEMDKIEIIKILINYKADPNIKIEHDRFTVLHKLCFKKNTPIEILNILLESKANPNSQDLNDRTPLHCGTFDEKSIDIIKLFIDYKVNPNLQDNFVHETLLHRACINDNPSKEKIELLLNKKAHPEIQNFYKETALHYLCDTNNPSIDTIKLVLINILGEPDFSTILLCFKVFQKKYTLLIPKVLISKIFTFILNLDSLEQFLNQTDINKDNALQIAENKKNKEIVLLLEKVQSIIQKESETLVLHNLFFCLKK